MPRPGKKNLKGVPESDWGEVKSIPIGTKVTPTGKDLFSSRFTSIPLSEIIERLGRGYLKLSPAQPSKLAEAIATEMANRKVSLIQFSELVGIPIDRLLILFEAIDIPTEVELSLLESFIKKDIAISKNPSTIKELLFLTLQQEALTIDALSKVTRIPEIRISCILQGGKPEHGELSLLARFLKTNIEELEQMCKKEFNGEKQEAKNGK